MSAASLIGIFLIAPASALWSVGSALIADPSSALPRVPAVVRTLSLAIVATLVCTMIGVACAFVIERTEVVLRRPLALALTLPLLLPPHIVAIALHSAMGSASPWVCAPAVLFDHPWTAAALVTILCYSPLVMWFAVIGLRSLPAAEEAHAALYLPWHRVVRFITLPGLRREILSAAALVFVLSIQSFDICSVAGLNTLISDVYNQAAGVLSFSGACRAALPVCLLAVGGVTVMSIGVNAYERSLTRRPPSQGAMPFLVEIANGSARYATLSKAPLTCASSVARSCGRC